MSQQHSHQKSFARLSQSRLGIAFIYLLGRDAKYQYKLDSMEIRFEGLTVVNNLLWQTCRFTVCNVW